MEVPKEVLVEIANRHEAGLYVQAHELARNVAPLEEWRGVEAQILAGRLAGNLGAERLGRWLHARAWRTDRTCAEAGYFRALDLAHYRGPYAAWRFLETQASFPGAAQRVQADLLGLRARVAAQFRDFDRAEGLLAEAEKLGGTQAWLWCERAFCLQFQDAFEEALQAAQEALRVRPWFRPAVQFAAQLLQTAGKDQEALELLRGSLEHVESGAIACQLAVVEFELGMHRESVVSWERMRFLSPLFNEAMVKWWEGRMAEAHYHCGDFSRAAEHARNAGEKFDAEFAERLSAPGAAKCRVHLEVGFVRQHHMTCAPATLSALSRYWGMAVDHAVLAEKICYDGTPDHVERHWAVENGYIAREFRVTWEAAVELLDRGVPFTLATVETTSAHLQAVIGYDAMRRTLLVRDPSLRIHQEFPVEPLLQRYAPYGPRGMALVPAGEADRLASVKLPDEEYYDVYHRLQRALHAHDRAGAEVLLAEMEQLNAEHRLTLFARRDLAFYDASPTRQLSCAEGLLARFPNSNNFRWSKLSALRELSRKSEYGEYLKEIAHAEDSDPLFWRELAKELSLEDRGRGSARRYALRALRWNPTEAESLVTFANLLWDQRKFSEATDLYRFASCMRDSVEGYARRWFVAARHLRQTDVALDWIRRRFKRLGQRSSVPASTLFQALDALDLTGEAFECLETAVSIRPEDGDLLLFAADANARHGRYDCADALLNSAEKHVARMAWLRTAAAIAAYRCDLNRSLALWSELIKAEPLMLDAQRAVTRLIAELDGRAAALIHIRAVCDRFPFHVLLHRLWIEWMNEESAKDAEEVIRRTLALDEADAWTRRELALTLARQRRFDEALAAADRALEIEPRNPNSHSVRAQVLLSAARFAEAREGAKETLRLAIDTSHAVPILINASESTEEKRAALAFIRDELVSQVVFGDGLLAYRDAAFPILEPAELLENLRQAHSARPDLWHTWSALVQQLLDMQQLEEALALANQATERFPLLPRLWYDLALVCKLKGREQEIAALERALQLSPGWSLPARALSSAHQRNGDFAGARHVLENAIASTPLDALNHGCLAEVLWLAVEKEAAIARVEQAIRIEPGYDWGWDALREWSQQMGIANRAEALARELTRERPGEARSWLRLAQSLPADRLEERLAALDRAVTLDPRYVDALDGRAILLAEANRFDEAFATCASPATGEALPVILQGRAAWIHARRGDLVTAVKTMRTVVEKSPDYYWGWSSLADWLAALERYSEALQAAKTMARLAPRRAAPLSYIADLQARLGNEREACDTLRRAFELDPREEYAGRALFDRQLKSGSLAEAEKTLLTLEQHQPGGRTRAARIRLLCRRKEKATALGELRSICFLPEREGPVIALAAGAFGEAGWAREAERVFHESLDAEGVNPEVGAQWVAHFTKRGSWGHRNRLYRLDPSSPLGRRARVGYLGAIGAQGRTRYMENLLTRDGASLREDVQCWGKVGYVYTTKGMFKQAVSWGADWSKRTDAEPWMLINLALALRSTGKPGEALVVNRAALELHGDHTTPHHALWVALEESIAGEFGTARARLATVPTQGLGAFHQAAHALATALISVQSAAPEERRAVYDQHKTLLRQSSLHGAFADVAMRPVAKRAVFALAKLAGRRPFRLGGTFQFAPSGRQSHWQYWRLAPLFFVILSAAARSCSGPEYSPKSNRPITLPFSPTPERRTPPAYFEAPANSTDPGVRFRLEPNNRRPRTDWLPRPDLKPPDKAEPRQ